MNSIKNVWTRQRFALAISIALNVLGAGYLLYSVRAPEGADGSNTNAPAILAGLETEASEANWRQIYTNARNAGLADPEAQYLLAGLLQAQRASTLRDAYWRPAIAREYELQGADRSFSSRARAMLLETFGPQAATSPAFAAMFRPLDPKASFLSSQQQLALQETQHRVLQQTAQAGPAGATTLGAAGIFSKAVLEQAKQLLSAEEMFELELRFSPTAARLADTAPNLSEAQFRDAYGLLRSPLQNDQSKQRVRELIGETRLAAFSTAANPMELALSNVMRKHGVSSEAAAAALKLVRSNASTPPQSVHGPSGLQSKAAVELQRLIGADAYSDYVGALSMLGQSTGR